MYRTPLQHAYPSDLTDAQWEVLAPLIPPIKPAASFYLHERRELVNAMLYVLRSGCPWRSLPHDFPAWSTVYSYFRKWQREGIWDRVLETLRMQMRLKEGRDPGPSAAVIDSQSIKTSAIRGPEKGYDAGKKIWGRKRHALVDSQGNLLEVKVTGADVSNQQRSQSLLLPLKEKYPRMKLIWGDSHSGGTFIGWLKVHLGWTMQTEKRAHCTQTRYAGAGGRGNRVGQALPQRVSPAAEKMGRGAEFCLDHALEATVPRS